MTTQPFTPDSSRLPRYTRAEDDIPLALTPRDLSILQIVDSFRLLTSEHIQHLIEGSDQGIARRLQKLFHAGDLDRLRPRWVVNGGSAKMVYAVTNQGIRTLQKEGVIQEISKTDLNGQNRSLHDHSIAHMLLVSHIRAMFSLACHATPGMEFLFWREGRELQDAIEVALPTKYAQLPVAPDGFFALRDAQGRRAHFFVEADRGTMSLKRFTRKLHAYAEYSRQEKHTAKFGIKHFRVLTVASSATRCQNLLGAAAAEEDVRALRRLFLFASEKNLPFSSPESVFAKIWTVPGGEAPCALFKAQSENFT